MSCIALHWSTFWLERGSSSVRFWLCSRVKSYDADRARRLAGFDDCSYLQHAVQRPTYRGREEDFLFPFLLSSPNECLLSVLHPPLNSAPNITGKLTGFSGVSKTLLSTNIEVKTASRTASSSRRHQKELRMKISLARPLESAI